MSASAKAFVDTNVFIYSLDFSDPRKQAAANRLLRTLGRENRLVISTQVLLEVFNVARKRLRLSDKDAEDFMAALTSYQVEPTGTLACLEAAALASQFQLSIWDALIIQAALASGCETLYTEDLQHGLSLRGLRIENPFLP
jgi:predicted nucleic acid-binding protein